MATVYAGRLLVQYGQFYVWDGTRQPLAPTEYTDADIASGMKLADEIAVIIPPRNGSIDLRVMLVDEPPLLGLEWQRVAHGRISTMNGMLELVEWPDRILCRVSISRGSVSLIYAFQGMTDEIAEAESGDDIHCVWIINSRA